ncbi:MAG: sulfatase, partial [Planctomycetaceae bacterium]
QKATIPNAVSRLDPQYYTLPEMLRDNGYSTRHFGKWHLGAEPYSPLQHGFDVDIPHHPGPGPAGSYVAPWKFKDFDHDPDIPNQHIEDRMAQEAVAFMEKNKNQPFFLNYWMFSVHAPFDAKKTLIDAYRQKANPKSPQHSPTYAAMIESMDDAVGTLLDTLDRLNIADNTIIVFASDNGGNMYSVVDNTVPTNNAPLRGGKATMYEGGVRGPAIVVQPNVIEPSSQSEQIIQSSDFYPTLLAMLDIEHKPDQHFDGVSITPAFQGRAIGRDAIFTYFPHSPGVPEWLPPSVSVHRGDWKLIRIFHGGNDKQHRYKLFNLRDDIGEKTNLADKHPDLVAELDKLIEQHLEQTNAVRPLPNPKFDPSQYDPSLEGKAKLKPARNRRGKPNNRKPSRPVAGWRAGGTCKLALKSGVLRVTSTGRDPYLTFRLPKTMAAGSFSLHITMKSTSSGNGQVFWQVPGKPFAAERSEKFVVSHDGDIHKYTIDFESTNPVQSIRIDPSNAEGTIDILAVELKDQNGKTLHRCKF